MRNGSQTLVPRHAAHSPFVLDVDTTGVGTEPNRTYFYDHIHRAEQRHYARATLLNRAASHPPSHHGCAWDWPFRSHSTSMQSFRPSDRNRTEPHLENLGGLGLRLAISGQSRTPLPL